MLRTKLKLISHCSQCAMRHCNKFKDIIQYAFNILLIWLIHSNKNLLVFSSINVPFIFNYSICKFTLRFINKCINNNDGAYIAS